MGHLAADCEGKAKRKAGEFDEKGDAEVVAKKPYQVKFWFWLHSLFLYTTFVFFTWLLWICVHKWFKISNLYLTPMFLLSLLWICILEWVEICSSSIFGPWESTWSMNSEFQILLLRLISSALLMTLYSCVSLLGMIFCHICPHLRSVRFVYFHYDLYSARIMDFTKGPFGRAVDCSICSLEGYLDELPLGWSSTPIAEISIVD